MKLSDYLDSLGKPYFYYPNLARMLGSVKACVLLCCLVWRDRDIDKGTVTKTEKEISQETGLTSDEVKTAKSKLIELGIIKVEHNRLQHITKITINFDVLESLFSEVVISHFPKSGNPTSGEGETPLREVGNPTTDLIKNENREENKIENRDGPESSSLGEENLDLERDVFEWCKATWGKNPRTRGVKFKAKYPEQWRRVEEAVGQEEFRKDWIENLERKEPLGPVDWIKTMQADNPRPAPRRSPAKRPKQTLQQELDALPDNVGWDPE